MEKAVIITSSSDFKEFFSSELKSVANTVSQGYEEGKMDVLKKIEGILIPTTVAAEIWGVKQSSVQRLIRNNVNQPDFPCDRGFKGEAYKLPLVWVITNQYKQVRDKWKRGE